MRLIASDVDAEIDGHEIVSSATIRIEAGSVVGLLGPNGSGKSTLLRCIYRVLRPRKGSVTLGEDDVWVMSQRDSAKRMAVVVQEPPSEFDLTVHDVVMMGRSPHLGLLSRTTVEDERIVTEALTRVGAAELAPRLMRTLSGGEKQRALLARALTQQGQVFVLDEPTNHLDIHHQLELLELVSHLRVTTICALHDLNLAATYCDHVYILRDGRVVADGSPGDVLTPQLIADVFDVGATRLTNPFTGKIHLAFHPLTIEAARR